MIREPHRHVRLILDTGLLHRRRVELGLSILEVGRRVRLGRTAIYMAFRFGDCGIRSAQRIAQVLGFDLAGLWVDPRTGQPWRPEGKDA